MPSYFTALQVLRERLRILESDLKDSEDPVVLLRYPHLGAEELKRQLRQRISEVKHMISSKETGDAPTEQPRDRVVEAVRADLLRRSQLGIQKYGMTLGRDDLTLKQWLQHAYEEALDFANYLKRAIIEIEHNEGEQP